MSVPIESREVKWSAILHGKRPFSV